MKKKSILHIVNIYFVLPYFIGDQFKYMKSKGYDMHVIASPSENLENYSLEQGFKYKEIPILRSFSILQDIKSLIEIIKYIRSNSIQIVVGHTPKGALLAMLAGCISGVSKRIYFRHGLMYETSKGFKRFLLISMERLTSFCANKIVCVSPSIYNKSLDDKLNPKKKQLVIGKGTCGGIDTRFKFNTDILDSTRLNDIRMRYSISDDDFVIGYCGRLVRDKGIIELVNALKYINQNYKIKLLLVGDYEERDALPNEIKHVIENNPIIVKTGFIFKDIEYYYALMNLFVLPSFREGFGMSVLEASSMAIPVLTTKSTGCVDSIVEGVTGYYVRNSSLSIANGIMRFITDYDGKQMGKNGRDFVVNNFDNRLLWPLFDECLYAHDKINS